MMLSNKNIQHTVRYTELSPTRLRDPVVMNHPLLKLRRASF